MYDVAVIGCGVIGAAAAHALAQYRCRTVILEAENDVSTVTTRANSGILHTGYDPKPGTWAARLNPEGARMAKELCAQLDVPIHVCGSLVLALAPEELPHLQQLYDYGMANGVTDLQLLSPDEVLAMEPAVSPSVAGALYAPGTAVINPWEYTLALAETAVKNGVELRRRSPVTAIESAGDHWVLTTPEGPVEARFVVNAAGLGAEALHNMVAAPCFKTTPSRGEYYLLDKSEGHLVSHVIFQCPSAAGKGVLVSRRATATASSARTRSRWRAMIPPQRPRAWNTSPARPAAAFPLSIFGPTSVISPAFVPIRITPTLLSRRRPPASSIWWVCAPPVSAAHRRLHRNACGC